MASVFRLTEHTLAEAVDQIARQDPHLAAIVAEFGPPPLWSRDPGFPTLIRIILEQQVSLASARATFDRLLAAAAPLTPDRFLDFDDAALRRMGFSRQKTAYCRNVAKAVANGVLNLESLNGADDATVKTELVRIKGIGSWTADIYLLMALGRPDVWPSGDLGLARAVQNLKGLDRCPNPEQLDELSAPWKPWRAVAARLLWHHYLGRLALRKAGRTM